MTKPDQLAQWAQQNGYTFRDDTEGFQTEGVRELDSFKNWDSAKNHITGDYHNRRFEMLDFTTYHSRTNTHGASRSSYRDQTALLLPGAAAGIADFEILPRNGGYFAMEFLGMGGLKLAEDDAHPMTKKTVDAFSEHYIIYAGGVFESVAGQVGKAAEPDLSMMSEICKPKVLEFLTRNPGWFIESQGEHLLLWSPGKVLSVDERSAILRTAIDLLGVLEQAKHERSVPGIALENTMDISRGKIVRILGCGAGGFFLGAICAMVLMFTTGSKLSLLAFPIFAFGGLAAGLFIGKKIAKSS
jgi:hypothetical protein